MFVAYLVLAVQDDDDGLGYNMSGRVKASLVSYALLSQGDIHRVVAIDAGKWDSHGTSIAVSAPLGSSSRFMSATMSASAGSK